MVAAFIPCCLHFTPKLGHFNRPLIHAAVCKNHRGARLKSFGVARPQILSPAFGEEDGLRVFVLSDLHTDYEENMNWINCLSSVKYRDDVLLVAGDVAETYSNFVSTMALLKDKFERVFFVPGNHDLWCRREGDNYVSCRRLGFLVPKSLLISWFVPLLVCTFTSLFDYRSVIPNMILEPYLI